MPFFMETPKTAKIIRNELAKKRFNRLPVANAIRLRWFNSNYARIHVGKSF